jgi:hypothetical protein
VDAPLNLTKQQRPTVARHPTCSEPGLHAARKMCCKREPFLVTLCLQRPLLFEAFSYVRTTQLCHENSGLLQPFLLAIITT